MAEGIFLEFQGTWQFGARLAYFVALEAGLLWTLRIEFVQCKPVPRQRAFS